MIEILPGFTHTLRLGLGNKAKKRDARGLFYYVAEDLDRPDVTKFCFSSQHGRN